VDGCYGRRLEKWQSFILQRNNSPVARRSATRAVHARYYYNTDETRPRSPEPFVLSVNYDRDT
jgi:hypothetical protein